MRRLLRTTDAWWPVLSRNGSDLVAGNLTLRAWHLPGVAREDDAGHYHLGAGRNGRFIHPGVITYTKELTTFQHERWEYSLHDGRQERMPDNPSLVAGNEFDACEDGHWGSWLDLGGRVVYDGRIIASGARGVKVAGERVCYRMDGLNEFVVRHMTAGLDTRYTLPPDANQWTLSPEGYIGYGYFWAGRMIRTDNSRVDISGSPWKRETPPVLVRGPNNVLWAWSWTQWPGTPDGTGVVMGRRVDEPTLCVQIPFTADAWVSAAWTGSAWIVAGNASEGGVMECWLVPGDAPRTLVEDRYQVRESSKPLLYTCYYDISTRYPERYDFPTNADTIVEESALPQATGPLIIPGAFVRSVEDPSRVYALVTANEDETRVELDLETQRAAFRAKWPDRPVPPILTYVLPGWVERGWQPDASSVDVFAPQFYFDLNQQPSEAALALWLTYWLDKLPTDRPWCPTVQAFDRNGVMAHRMWDLAALTPRFLDLANEYPFIQGFMWFSSERPGGAADYRCLQQAHAACFAVLPSLLPVLPTREAEMLKKPEVTVTSWDRELTPANTWRVRFFDRENDCHVYVRLEQGRLWIEMSNAKGVGKTGAVRQVTIRP